MADMESSSAPAAPGKLTHKQKRRAKLMKRRANHRGNLPGNRPPLPKKSGRSEPPDVLATKAFLKSFEWRQLRMKALVHYGAKCQCCGATPATGAVMNVDHIKPRRLFPELALEFSNLQVLCEDCNHGKANWDATDWRTGGEA